jgi:hypothetical protein
VYCTPPHECCVTTPFNSNHPADLFTVYKVLSSENDAPCRNKSKLSVCFACRQKYIILEVIKNTDVIVSLCNIRRWLQ